MDAYQAQEYNPYAESKCVEAMSYSQIPPIDLASRSRPTVSKPPLPGNEDKGYQIAIMVSDQNYEILQWTVPIAPGQTISAICLQFLRDRKLKEAFQEGLLAKMRELMGSGQKNAMVDICDLI